jgi:hypothetical protein
MSYGNDWPTSDNTSNAGSDGFDPENYSFGAMAPAKSADEIESSREYKQVPPGDHELVVVGFGKMKDSIKNVWYQGQQYSYKVMSVGVRLALANDPKATVMDFFDLPPEGNNEQILYQYGTKANDNKPGGFMAEKLGHFVARLGWPCAKGSPIPAEACRLGNWKGRRVIATIEHVVSKDALTGGPKLNQMTGEPYPPQASVKLFSYRPAAGNVGGTVAANPRAHANVAHQPAAQPAPHRPSLTPPLTPAAAPSPAAPSRMDQLANLL